MRLDHRLKRIAISDSQPAAGPEPPHLATPESRSELSAAHRVDFEEVDDHPGGASTEWLSRALSLIPMPTSPIERPWEFAVSSLIHPHLPTAVRRFSHLLDRLGGVRLDPTSISIDSVKIDWHDIVEVRAQPLTSVLGASGIDGINAAIGNLMPVSRLARRSTQWLSVRLSHVIVSVFLIVLEEHGNQHVPTEIVYRRRGREQTMNPAILSTSVLALPKVAECVLTTARACGATVVLEQAPESVINADIIRLRMSELASSFTSLFGSARSPEEPPVSAGAQLPANSAYEAKQAESNKQGNLD